MRHKVKISVSEKSKTDGLISCRNVTIRERLLNFLIGDKRKVTVLIPGDSIKEISICEEEGGEKSGQSKTCTRRNPKATQSSRRFKKLI